MNEFPPSLWLAGAFGVAGILGLTLAQLREWSHRRSIAEAEAIRRAYTRGTVHGLNLGWIHHGRTVAERLDLPLHGFGAECHGCRRIYGIIAGADDEYWTCSSCGHRNPAPLVAEDPTILVTTNLPKS